MGVVGLCMGVRYIRPTAGVSSDEWVGVVGVGARVRPGEEVKLKLAFRVRPTTLIAIDRAAAGRGLTRSGWLRLWVAHGLSEAQRGL